MQPFSEINRRGIRSVFGKLFDEQVCARVDGILYSSQGGRGKCAANFFPQLSMVLGIPSGKHVQMLLRLPIYTHERIHGGLIVFPLFSNMTTSG